MARWRVDIIRNGPEHLGTVEAYSKKEAIEKAAKRFGIEPARGFKLAVEKISERGK